MYNFGTSKKGVRKMENIINLMSNMKVKQEQQKYNILVSENIPPKIKDLEIVEILKTLDEGQK